MYAAFYPTVKRSKEAAMVTYLVAINLYNEYWVGFPLPMGAT